MKKILLPLAIVSAIIFSACNSKTEQAKRDMVLLNDSMYRNSMNSDTSVTVQNELIEEAPLVELAPPPVRRAAPQKIRNRNNNDRTYDNNQTTPPVVVNNPAPAPAPVVIPTSTGTETTAGTGTTGTTETEKVPAKKTGISKGAQGAIIGGVGGAVAGAVISKKGKGAVIGGIIGAAGGYILGRKKDKADGRVNN